MAVRIRLTRVGATKQPTYRVVVADGRSARDGRAIETLGHYNPRTEPVEFKVDEDKAKAWLAKGAQPSDTVAPTLPSGGHPARRQVGDHDGRQGTGRIRRQGRWSMTPTP